MSGAPPAAAAKARTALRLAAEVAQAAAKQAAEAANAPPQVAGIPGGAPEQQALVLIAHALQRQELSAAAARAQAAADAASRAADAEASLAQQRRAAAGPAPLFNGKGKDLEAHRWLAALEQWFASAHVGADDSETRLEIAKAALRDAAAAWWSTKLANGTAATLGTWDRFAEEVRKHFIPLDPERWALREREALIGAALSLIHI